MKRLQHYFPLYVLIQHFLRPLVIETILVYTSLCLSLCVNFMPSAGSPVDAYIWVVWLLMTFIVTEDP